MHPVLECDDIFRDIILALEGPGSSQTLAALAITCKALSEPALDALWENCYFYRLLELFPQDLFVESEWRLARPIMPIDWTRSRFYASRVKTLEVYEDCAEVLKAMGPFYPSSGLLPNLRRLVSYSDDSELDITTLRVLLHPQVKEVVFYNYPPSITNLSFLSALPVLCPHLTDFTFSFNLREGDYPETAAVISTLVPALQMLESLRLNLDVHVGELNLGLLSNLTTLHLTGGPTVVGSFPRLRDISVNHIDAVSAIELLSSAAVLDMVKIDLWLAPTSPQVAELVRTLKSVASSTSLKTLSLSLLPADDMPADVMEAQTLRELSFFSGLKSVHIEWFFGPDLDDRTLEFLTTSWTQLTNLQLVQRGTDTNLTLKSLLPLARNCPHLQHLDLKVDAREVPELPRVAPQRTLNSMDVASSPIQSATKVARYISGIFPDVEHVWSSTEFPERRQLWNQVLEQLPEFVALRKEVAEQVRAG
ncbi:hypothetical protein C8R45DRAFT_1025676 [Mycena sanguinolenta]|nr:hypothetical protein C8R45DRAFT_1025676 [Mycena sanguinolenta]